MKNVTPIDGLVDIDSIPSEINPNLSYNTNLNEQIELENINRNEKRGPITNKLVRSNDWRTAVNGGSHNAFIEQIDVDMSMIPKNRRPDHMFPQQQQTYFPQQITCLDIADHVSNCPICTRFYAPEDRTHLYFLIIVLAIICFVLFRKLMDLK